MNPGVLVLALLVPAVGAAAYYLGQRRRRAPSSGRRPDVGLTARMVPDPALGWLVAAHEAIGAWVIDGTSSSTPGLARHLRDPAAVTSDIEQRLEQLRASDGDGVERIGRGVLVYQARGGLLAAMVLPAKASSSGIDSARAELRALALALTDRPAILSTREHQVPVQTLGVASHTLAIQAERINESPTAVVVNLRAGPQVVAVSPIADRRLLAFRADPESPAGRVSRGMDGILFTPLDPLGSSVVDRRRSQPCQVIPIGVSDPPVGVILVWPGRGKELVGEVLSQLLEAAREAEPRLYNARQYHELGQTAKTDPLTGLLNRRGLEEALARVGVEEGGALIYADLDRFKGLNDTLGHPAGDAALVHVAGIIHDFIRHSDAGARLGGEEFAVWLPGADLARGLAIAERIRDTLTRRIWTWQSTQWPISASFGVSACPETTRSRQNLPAQADAALYRAKAGGRNRVESAERVD